MKGIVLAGASGTRLYPLTHAVSKHILPVYNKPMIYYPLSVLMLGGIKEILVISTPSHIGLFQGLLGDGSQFGLSIEYAVQSQANGIAEAFVIGEEFIGDDSVALVLGDNIFHGPGLSDLLSDQCKNVDGCVLFGYAVKDPERYGVGEVDARGELVSLEEKPVKPRSNLAITGLYLYDNGVVDIARKIRPSARGEREITDINQVYLERGRARMVDLGRGFAWLDAGTHDSLLQAGQYIQVLEERQGVRIACLEEIAFRMGFIDSATCYALGEQLKNSDYGAYLMAIASADHSEGAACVSS